ncbi:MAG: replication initiator protein [Microviridae sp.]|nr:MAG: replication initiator protein [Microviridae sp.]
MACFYPRPAFRTPSGAVVFGHPRFGEPVKDDLRVGCGKCIGCGLMRSRDWSVRCALEAAQHNLSCWSTLTYDDANLPSTLRPDHLSGFVKRLRSRLAPRKFRVFACGEYGDKFGRPHYHAILFGVRDVRELQKAWGFGIAEEHTLSPEAISYVAGYCAKKLRRPRKPLLSSPIPFGPRLDRRVVEKVDKYTGEVTEHYVEYQPPFLEMSRRPGIGGDARRFTSMWRRSAVFRGKEVPVPRFLHESWKEQATADEILFLEEERKREMRVMSWDEIKASERIAEVQMEHTLSRRSL